MSVPRFTPRPNLRILWLRCCEGSCKRDTRRSSQTHAQPTKMAARAAGPRTALLEACLGVCETSSAMVRAVYDLVPTRGSGAATLKSDNSEFTLAVYFRKKLNAGGVL